MIRRFRAVLAAMLLSVAAVLGFSGVANAHSNTTPLAFNHEYVMSVQP